MGIGGFLRDHKLFRDICIVWSVTLLPSIQGVTADGWMSRKPNWQVAFFSSKSLSGGGYAACTVFPISYCKFTSMVVAEHDGKLLI